MDTLSYTNLIAGKSSGKDGDEAKDKSSVSSSTDCLTTFCFISLTSAVVTDSLSLSPRN